MYGRLHSDICNVPLYLLPCVRLQIKPTKAKSSFNLMNKSNDSKTIFKFLEAKLIVNRVWSNPEILIAHHEALNAGYQARYNLIRVELMSFTFSS
jgi:hypothetical protein